MKIRKGFVSNSSSSSFVAVVDPKAYEGLKLGLNQVELRLLESMEEPGKRELNGNYYVLLVDYMHTEEPEQAEVLEEIFEEEGVEALKKILDLEEDNVDLSLAYVRANMAVGIVEEIRDKINNLKMNGKAIVSYQSL